MFNIVKEHNVDGKRKMEVKSKIFELRFVAYTITFTH